jgi:uncharacterized protein YbjT (DUF2867 family)
MRVLVFGATGMVGQGVLLECLQADDVAAVRAVGRTPSGRQHPKLSELAPADLMHCETVAADLQGFDACFFCLGVSAGGLDEARYSRITHDLTLAVAGTLVRLNPGMTFVYVSGAGTDSSERGRSMWARVKGRTENALQRLPFKAVYLFRPGAIVPLDGIRSKTAAYRVLYTMTRPLWPLLRALFPDRIATTRSIGLAMLEAARHGAPQAVLEAADIAALARRGAAPPPAH